MSKKPSQGVKSARRKNTSRSVKGGTGGTPPLETRSFWSSLQKQFTKAELEMFKDDWNRTIAQFGDDVTHTEEKQIVQSCSLSILMYRCLEEIQESKKLLSRLQTQYQTEFQKVDRDTDILNQLDSQMSAVRSASASLTAQYDKLLRDQQTMQKDLKSTRDQRINKLNSEKTTFFSWLKWLQDDENLKRESIEMELRRLAEYKTRLLTGQAQHTYVDGSIDCPLLNQDSHDTQPSRGEVG